MRTLTARTSFLLFAALLFASAGVKAGDHRYVLSPEYVRECGSCHIAFPAELLPAGDWRAIMARLDRHYGTDASLDERTQTRLTSELERAASTRDKHAGSGTPPRLTLSAWFGKEHGKLPAKATATLPAASQCDSCHRNAATGDYTERDITLPANYRKER
jgi:hypothetical protein